MPQIDGVLTEFGMPVGPFGMQDIAGIDVGARIRQYLKSIGKTRAEGPQSEIPDRLFEMGRYGQKTGAGWYRYEAGSRDPHPGSADRPARRGSGGAARHRARADCERRDHRADHDGAGQRGRARPGGGLREPRRRHRCDLLLRLRLPAISRRADVLRRHRRPADGPRADSRVSRRGSATTGVRRRSSNGSWRRDGGSTRRFSRSRRRRDRDRRHCRASTGDWARRWPSATGSRSRRSGSTASPRPPRIASGFTWTRSRAAAESPFRHDHRARLSHAVARVRAASAGDPAAGRPDGDQLRDQPRALHVARSGRIQDSRSIHSSSRSTATSDAVDVTWSVTLERQSATKPCCVAEWIVRYYVSSL